MLDRELDTVVTEDTADKEAAVDREVEADSEVDKYVANEVDADREVDTAVSGVGAVPAVDAGDAVSANHELVDVRLAPKRRSPATGGSIPGVAGETS